MVILYGHIVSVLRLIRWPNLLIVAATQILTRQCILAPLLRGANMDIQVPPFIFFLLVISTVFIAAGGYAINDYFDRKIDMINKPDSMVVGTHIYPRHAMAWHLIFTITGVILGAFVAIRLGLAYLSLIFFMVSGLLWFYSTTYKSELLLGNIIVALLTALVPFIVLVFEIPLLAKEYGSPFREISKYLIFWITGFSLFAFLLNLTREIVKDAQDFEGDQAYGK
ncbi:MAG TPA: geranylgeranylglycerol-phosphate geranylgeranyltransferase, partial [Bacteroidales bacterium]|nr:geranylgeranylglycerol-phosphate geranylgeranyltransferase [Bacteroidales bacterium]